jgi:hypothetical protein
MLKTTQGLGGLLLCGILASAACSDSEPGDGDEPNAAGEGGGGVSSGSGGKSGAGKGGTKAGSAGKGGTGGSSAGAGGASGEAGDGAKGGEGPSCPGCASGFCLDDGTCVDCLPSDDQCPEGQYCSEANECAPGCKRDGGGCASGVCLEDHSCQQCISDAECSGDEVCGNGQCAPACTAQQEGQSAGCAVGLTCCSLHCTQVETDSKHCGVCGETCGQSQFCGLAGGGEGGQGGQGGQGGAGSSDAVACHDTTLANLCSIGKVIVILDTTKNPSDGNRVPGRAIGDALEDKCVPSPTVIEAEQDSVDALNFTTGRPVSGGGELLVVAGGPFFQNLEAYVESKGISPLYLFSDMGADLQQFKSRADDSVVASRTISGDNESHDFFAIQFMSDPQSGSLVLNAQGFWLSGTNAASFYMLNGILPDIASYDQAWYVYEWTDGNGDKLPDLNEIELTDSGK